MRRVLAYISLALAAWSFAGGVLVLMWGHVVQIHLDSTVLDSSRLELRRHHILCPLWWFLKTPQQISRGNTPIRQVQHED